MLARQAVAQMVENSSEQRWRARQLLAVRFLYAMLVMYLSCSKVRGGDLGPEPCKTPPGAGDNLRSTVAFVAAFELGTSALSGSC